MSAPKWGIFMSNVYADKRLGYGKSLEFDLPAELKNDPIYAEANFANIATSGDSLNTEENNNENDLIGTDENNEMTDESKNKKTSTDSLKSKQSPKKKNDYK
jgi:hypothetical protein